MSAQILIQILANFLMQLTEYDRRMFLLKGRYCQVATYNLARKWTLRQMAFALIKNDRLLNGELK